ncbi:hypothetical protein OHA25_08695 [Nonomuraea sp. NBC_00507]|uniref:hypothetical protein n=1 Tax=Nonomuraea sp. NBC_00507 TaxID=2976002 RepID=UPI002E1758CE
MIVKKISADQIEAMRVHIERELSYGEPGRVGADETLSVIAAYKEAAAEAEQLLDALRAVREALDIPHAATVGGDEVRDQVLLARQTHAMLMIERLVDGKPHWGIGQEVSFLRERLAENPATGYVTGEQARAARAAGATYEESVTPPGPEASAAGDTPVSPAAVTAVMRRASDLIDQQPYGHVDVFAAIAQAAGEHTDRSDHVEQLSGAVLAVIAELLGAGDLEAVRRWSQARPHEVVVAFLSAAATAREQREGGRG